MIWGGDHSLDGEDYPVMSGEYSMVTNLSCHKCNSFVEVYLPRDAYDWDTRYSDSWDIYSKRSRNI